MKKISSICACLLLCLITSCTHHQDETYIPKDLEDCHVQLDKILNPGEVEKITSGEIEPVDMHFGLGMWMRNNWGLWGNSRLSDYFTSLGIHHPDDMSGIIIASYVAKLRNETFDLDKVAEECETAWTNQLLPDIILSEIHFTDVKLIECLDYFSKQTKNLDPDSIGIQFELDTTNLSPDISITMEANNVSMIDLLEMITELIPVQYSVIGGKVIIRKANKPVESTP